MHERGTDGLNLTPSHCVVRLFLQSYLAEAVNFLEHETNGTSVDAIKGIWVASDDENIVDEVRKTAGAYFPSVLSENIVYVAGGVPGGPQSHKIATHTDAQVQRERWCSWQCCTFAISNDIMSSTPATPTLRRQLLDFGTHVRLASVSVYSCASMASIKKQTSVAISNYRCYLCIA